METHPQTEGRSKTGIVLLLAFVAALLIPPIVFLLVGFSEGMAPRELFDALRAQFVARKQNLLVVGALGWFPLALLGILVWILGKIRRISTSRQRFCTGGSLAILAVLLWVNFQYWPTFLPRLTYAGFPHGLEFIIGPLVIAPIAMLAGLLLAAFWPKPANP